jgi:hypothetical protein
MPSRKAGKFPRRDAFVLSPGYGKLCLALVIARPPKCISGDGHRPDGNLHDQRQPSGNGNYTAATAVTQNIIISANRPSASRSLA